MLSGSNLALTLRFWGKAYRNLKGQGFLRDIASLDTLHSDLIESTTGIMNLILSDVPAVN